VQRRDCDPAGSVGLHGADRNVRGDDACVLVRSRFPESSPALPESVHRWKPTVRGPVPAADAVST
jgi:hypothetical protein